MVRTITSFYLECDKSCDILKCKVANVNVCPVSWLLYEKPGFQGRSIALEEGPAEIANEWAETEPSGEMQPNGLQLPTTPMVIGSIRLALRVSKKS